MEDLPRAQEVIRAADGAEDHIDLDYDSRFLRRKRLTSANGLVFLLDLVETVSLDDGDAVALADGRRIVVRAAAEPLLEITGPDLARLAWHIGNRHNPCQIEPGRLLIRDDPVIARMLAGLGARTRSIRAAFHPEGGAYGHGRTLGHSHAHDVDGHDEGA